MGFKSYTISESVQTSAPNEVWSHNGKVQGYQYSIGVTIATKDAEEKMAAVIKDVEIVLQYGSAVRAAATEALKKVALDQLQKAHKDSGTDLQTALKDLNGAGFTVQYRVTYWADGEFTVLPQISRRSFVNLISQGRST